MENNGSKKQHPANARPETSTLLIRLALVLVAAAAFVILFKPATAVDGKLQALLDAEVAAVRAGDRQAFRALYHVESEMGAWWRYQEAVFENYQAAADEAVPAGSQPLFPTLEVVEATRETDTAWALVAPAGDEGAPHQIVFFRRVAGRWLFAPPDPAYWGEPAVHQSLYFVWRYQDGDEAWVKEIAPAVDAAWGQIGADFDVPLPGALILIEVCYSFDCATEPGSQSTPVYVATPLLPGRSVEETKETLVSSLVRRLGALAVGAGEEIRAVGSSVLLSGLYLWEVEQVTGRVPGRVAPVLAAAVASDALLSFDEMSTIPDRTSYELARAQGYALVDYFVTGYGHRALPALLRAAGVRSGVGTALEALLPEGVNMAAFEEQWRDYVRTTYHP